MIKMVLQVDGMMCGMCEAHVNDAIRQNCKVKKVFSSHKKQQVEIIAETALDEEQLRNAVEKTGYKVKAITTEPYEKKSIFSFL